MTNTCVSVVPDQAYHHRCYRSGPTPRLGQSSGASTVGGYRPAKSCKRFLIKGSLALSANSRTVRARCFLNSSSNMVNPTTLLTEGLEANPKQQRYNANHAMLTLRDRRGRGVIVVASKWPCTPCGNLPSARNRFTLMDMAARGRPILMAISFAESIGHRAMSSRSSSSVQRMTRSLHGAPKRKPTTTC